MDNLEIKASLTVDDAGTITGIAWPFGTPDRVGDVIEKGAFTAPGRVPNLVEMKETGRRRGLELRCERIRT